MGTPQFAVVSLNKLHQGGIDIIAVVTAPDKPVGRGLKLLPSPVKIKSQELSIPVLQPTDLKDPSFLSKIDELNPDLMIIVAFRILPEVLFSKATSGAVNLHGSLLPKYRGAAPINWAIINGEKETGVTTILIDEKVDTGNMLLQKQVELNEDMTAGQLHDILAEVGSRTLIETLDKLAAGTLQAKKQDDALATKAPKLNKELCHISFDQRAESVYNLIRGLNPYPAAFVFHKGKQIKIFGCKIGKSFQMHNSPGIVINKSKSEFKVACKTGSILIDEVQLQGKRRMSVKDFFNGYNIEIGDILK